MTTHIHKNNEEAETKSSCCAHDSIHGQKMYDNSNNVTEYSVASEDHENFKSVPPAEGAVLEELKNEILMSINKQHRAPLSWGSATVSVVLGVLALLSILQTVQTASLYSKLKSGDFKSSPAAVGVPSGSGQGLPNQVGGC
ncbi:MAG: hypothetical protein HY981_04430 [Candidatus Magasanikbacteria bacterium]|nr:hypothetical protein [Candidatus Magasanikbacteria bacterium]